MKIKEDIFQKIYMESLKDTSPIDDLTKENIITIEEDVYDQGEEFNSDSSNDDGWNEEIVEKLSPLLDDIESFIYELKNCKRGSFTKCKTKEELKNYMIENLAARLEEEAADI